MLNRFVQLTAPAPAKMFGLFLKKGIAIGSDADLVLCDPNPQHTLNTHTHHSNVNYSLFKGHEVQGNVQNVFLRGEWIVDGDTWPAWRAYQKRSASGRIL